jgi:hypothetical protein
MTTHTFHLAQRTLQAEPTEPITIVMDKEFPKMISENLDALDERFLAEARGLCEVLYKHLPGGVFDRLLGEMLQRKASHFVVSHKE